MDFDVDAEVAHLRAWLEARQKAEETPLEEIDTRRLLPLFVPASLCGKTWCGPYYRLRNPDVGLTWCVLMEGGVIYYVNHRMRAHWEAKGIDWRRLALCNLIESSKKEAGITVLKNTRGETWGIHFRSADGLGSSHLVQRSLLSEYFPKGYRVALPDRNRGLAFSAELGPEDLSSIHKTVGGWHARGSYPLASGTYEPDDLLPEKMADRERHLAHLGQNPMKDVLRVVMDAYRRGDYEEAVRQSEGMKLLGEVTRAYCFYRGANLGHLGRLDEAEQWLRRNIAMLEEDGNTRLRAIGLTALGQVLLQAARYREAEECFEQSIALCSERGSGYRYMAELRLLRGDEDAGALRWAEQAVSREEADTETPPELRNRNLGGHLAALAWATAVASHDATAVTRLAGEAVASVGDGVVESTARVRYLLGRAFAELGDRETAARHYGEAARFDPNGQWGRAGKAGLEAAGASL